MYKEFSTQVYKRRTCILKQWYLILPHVQHSTSHRAAKALFNISLVHVLVDALAQGGMRCPGSTPEPRSPSGKYKRSEGPGCDHGQDLSSQKDLRTRWNSMVNRKKSAWQWSRHASNSRNTWALNSSPRWMTGLVSMVMHLAQPQLCQRKKDVSSKLHLQQRHTKGPKGEIRVKVRRNTGDLSL